MDIQQGLRASSLALVAGEGGRVSDEQLDISASQAENLECGSAGIRKSGWVEGQEGVWVPFSLSLTDTDSHID